LLNSIRWINQNAIPRSVSFVIVTGDLTDSGENSEFIHVKNLMDSLRIPWFSVLGNHETWPYTTFKNEAPVACGDSLFDINYNDVRKSFYQKMDINDTVESSVYYDPRVKRNVILQNYSFVFKGVRFIILDLNPRYHVNKSEPGIGPEVCLHEENGGSLDFLKEHLHRASVETNMVFIISHHPVVSQIVCMEFF